MLQSLNRGIEILEYLSKQHNDASITEIATVFNISKSTASRIMATLVEHGLVFRDEETKKHRLGVGMLMYSYHVMTDNLIMNIARPILLGLVENTESTAHLGVLYNRSLYVLDHVKSNRNRYMKDPTIPGMQEPLHCTAVGKAVLAYMPVEEARSILESIDRTRFTDHTVTDVDEILHMLEEVRKKGYAVDQEELREGVFCMAVPVFDCHGFVTHSIGLTGTYDFGKYPELFQYNLTRLRAAGKELSKLYDEALNKAASQNKTRHFPCSPLRWRKRKPTTCRK